MYIPSACDHTRSAGEAHDFVKEFEKVEKHIAKAKGNLAFALMKPAGMAVLYVLLPLLHISSGMLEVAMLHSCSCLPGA